ncbi:T7SS effector LXG polymorphic toxin [Shouchella rhizosphaerae]|uniref:T7SS effector LXG polymorphic toxin n=1 Tax=Shouchella rhizosphaerae TaxID=866786 RepID=UPI00272419FF|nr:T7SS effector LXG polymorphic toxin [Shouchella rhizosphaerae]MDP0463101.1 T7SS effector LXG polymorphic toxin [Shouchella rhizosphaerae]
MNTLDVQEVLDALDEIVERKLHDQAQLERLQASIQKIIDLDSLQGEGGEAIKDHFATLHLPVLAAFQLFIGQYIEQLKQIRSNLLNFESSSALIREEFLADVKNGLDRVERYAIEDATAIESIRASIADLLPLPPFSMEPVLRYAQQGKDHVRVTAERLGNLDEANEAVLSSAKSTLQELTTVVSQVADWSSGGVIPSPETQAEIDANMEKLYQNVVTQALQMAPLDRSHVEGREGDLYQDVLPLEFLYTGAYAPLYSGLKAANWYYLNHFPVSAILSNEQALQACRAPAMGATQAVSPSYFPLFARLSTLPVEATVSPDVLTQQLQQLVPIQYQWYQAQLRNQAIHTDTSQVVAIPEYMFTDQEVAAINTYLENHPPNEERLNTNPIVTGVVDFLFGDYITLVDPEASLGEKALATTFILVKPAKVGGVIYDLSKARKVKTGNRTSQVNKVNIPENSIKHSNIGDFTTNPRTGAISRMKGGGHGQSNIEFLEKNNVDYNITQVYENGVRVGNVPGHKVKAKRTGSNQSWFPENWTESDITAAGAKVAESPKFANAENGVAIFGEYKGVRVGVIKTNGEIGTIFPDATKQP